MEEKPKSKKWLIVIIVILIVAILSVGGYFVYQKIFNKQNTNQEIKEDTKNEIEQEIKLDTNSELVQNLYKLFHEAPFEFKGEYIFYTGKLIKESDIIDDVKISYAYHYLTEGEYTFEEFAQTGFIAGTEEGYNPRPIECKINDFITIKNEGEWYGRGRKEYDNLSQGLCLAEVISKENIIKSSERLFGKNSLSEVTYKDEYFIDYLLCKVDSENFYCHGISTGSGWGYIYEYTIKEAIQKGQEIYIYDYAMSCSILEFGVTTCYNANEEEVFSKPTPHSEEITEAEIIEHAPLYKHIFKQNVDGTYYWYSSEPVKE